MCHTFTTIAVCYEARKSSSCLSGVCVHECIFMKGSVQPYVFLYGWKQCDCAQPSIAFVSFLLFSNSLVCPPAFTVVSPVDYSNGSLHTHRVTQPKSSNILKQVALREYNNNFIHMLSNKTKLCPRVER